MDTKSLEKSIKTIINTGAGYSPEFMPVLKDTKKILKRINKGRPTAENYFQLGSLCLKLEDQTMALEAFETGFQLNPTNVNCGTYAALLLENQERWQDALNYYKQLNEIDPGNIQIVDRMLLLFYQQNDIKQVLKLCYYFLEKKLYYPSIYEYISKVYYSCGNLSKAMEYMRNALTLDPDNEEYKNRLVHHLYKAKEFKPVVEQSDYISETAAVPVEIKLLLANSLAELGRHKESRSYFVRLLKEGNRHTVLAEIALYHIVYELNYVKGNQINRYILKRDPNNIHALTNLALYSDEEYSLAAYEKVINQCPNDPLFRMNYGHKLLEAGMLSKGFEFYEARISKSLPFLEERLTYLPDIKNKKIFVWNEQGIGDQYAWSWMFRLLEESNVSAKIQVDKRLVDIMQRSFPRLTFFGDKVLDIFYNEDFKSYDAEVVFVSLGKYYVQEIKQAQLEFENGTILEPHIKVNEQQMEAWKTQLKSMTSLKTVGVCWRSGLLGDSRDLSYLTAELIADIFKDLDCTVVNLQYDYLEEELSTIRDSLGNRFIHFPELDLKNSQDELASLMKSLDLVFSVGTAVLSLAGAIGVKSICPGGVATLGKPFNIMLPTIYSIDGPYTMRKNIVRQRKELKLALDI